MILASVNGHLSFSNALVLFLFFFNHLLVRILSGRAFPFQGDPFVNGLLVWLTCGSTGCLIYPQCPQAEHISGLDLPYALASLTLPL